MDYEQRSREAAELITSLKERVEELKAALTANSMKVEEDVEIQQLEKENSALQLDIDSLREELSALNEKQNRRGFLHNGKPVAGVDLGKVKAIPVKVMPTAGNTTPSAQQPASAPPTAAPAKAKAAAPGPAKPAAASGDDGPVDVSRCKLVVGKIVECQRHPDADALYVEQIDVGEDKPRTVISGLVKHVPLEEMQGRMVVCITNLKPAKMRGIVSEGMVMCASSPDKVEIIDPPAGAQPGDRVTCPGYDGAADEPHLNPKKKVFEAVQPDFLTTAELVATYKGAPWTVAGKGVCTAKSMANANIK